MDAKLPYNPKVVGLRIFLALVTGSLLILAAKASAIPQLADFADLLAENAGGLAILIAMTVLPVDYQAKLAAEKAVREAVSESDPNAPDAAR